MKHEWYTLDGDFKKREKWKDKMGEEEVKNADQFSFAARFPTQRST
jgi:hypothetical protein